MQKQTTGPAKVPDAIRAAILQEEAAQPKADPDVEARLAKAGKSLDAIDIQELARHNPEKALMYLDLQAKLEVALQKQDERRQQGQFQLRMLVEVEKQLADQEANQRVCERSGHAMPNGESAVHGQTDSGGTYRLTCVRCFQNYCGIGAEAGQLPNHLAQRVDWENVGKSH